MLTGQSTAPAFDTASYPRTYGVAPGWKWPLVILGLGLTVVAIIGMLRSATLVASNSAAAVSLLALCSAFALSGVYLVGAMFCYRLVLDEDTIEVIGPLRHRTLRREDIRGRREPRQGFAILALVPTDDSARELQIPLLIRTDAAFARWMSSFEDLSAAAKAIEMDKRTHDLAVRRSEQLSPGATSLAMPVPASTGHETSADEVVFTYPRTSGYAALGAGLAALGIGMFLELSGEAELRIALMCTAFACVGFGIASYTFRYRVIVGPTTMTFGAFQFETIRLADVSNMKLITANAGGNWVSWYLRIYLRDGSFLDFRYGLQDFARLIDLIHARTGAGSDIAGAAQLRHMFRPVLITVVVMLAIMALIVAFSTPNPPSP